MHRPPRSPVRRIGGYPATAAAIWLLTLHSSAFASGTVALKGSVNKECYISVSPLNTTLNIADGASRQLVGRIGERCNDRYGYKVTLTSVNAGALINRANGRAAYTVTYDSEASRSLSTPLSLVRPHPRKNLEYFDLAVSLPATPAAVAGDYWDTITITIAAN